jgi:arylsulfatase A
VLRLWALWAAMHLASGPAMAAVEHPNIVLILADDLGWTDLSCYGSDLYQSPHIDRLAQDGVRFTQNYSACCVCSPTRAALLTGKYPARLHVTDWIPGQPPANPRLIVPDFTKHLPLEEVTLAEALHPQGYATGSIGKWHLGDEAYYPERHGFDVNIAGTHAPQPAPGYFAPYNIATLPQGPDGEYVTDRLGEEAVKFIRAHAQQPFFLYLPHFAVHTPIQAKSDLVEKYKATMRAGLRHQNSAYAAMIESMDDAVGRVLTTLAELGLTERTIVIFTSDNGGRVPTTSNVPLRVGKGACYEGGTRVPLIVAWPGTLAGGRTCDTPVITCDLYPTLLALAGVPLPDGVHPDGVSLMPLLKESGSLAERSLYWHYPHYQHYQQGGTTPYSAIRKGDHKLIEYLADGRTELYDLAHDIGETHDLAAAQPERVESLRKDLHEWRKAVGSQLPTPNPAYDPTKPEHPPKPQ